jgi:hypothetical protein
VARLGIRRDQGTARQGGVILLPVAECEGRSPSFIINLDGFAIRPSVRRGKGRSSWPNQKF